MAIKNIADMENVIREIDAERDARNAPRRPCFVIAPIGEPGSDSRRRSDKVLRHIIRPAVEACGYEATRADEIAQPGMITTQVVDRLLNDPLVIADLTERNPNVFYELALRHAIRKPFIQLIRAGDAIPFDVAGLRTIQIDHTDLDSAADARQEISDQIRAIEGNSASVVTPVSVAVDIRSLTQSGTPEDRSIAAIMTSIAELKASVDILRANSARNAMTNDDESRVRIPPVPPTVGGILAKLPTDERAIYGLRRSRMPIASIAQILGMSEKTVLAKIERIQFLLHTVAPDNLGEPEPQEAG